MWWAINTCAQWIISKCYFYICTDGILHHSLSSIQYSCFTANALFLNLSSLAYNIWVIILSLHTNTIHCIVFRESNISVLVELISPSLSLSQLYQGSCTALLLLPYAFCRSCVCSSIQVRISRTSEKAMVNTLSDSTVLSSSQNNVMYNVILVLLKLCTFTLTQKSHPNCKTTEFLPCDKVLWFSNC